MLIMEPPMNDNGISIKSPSIQLQVRRMVPQKELEDAAPSTLIELNKNGLPGTSKTSEFLIKDIPKTKSVNNLVFINYAGQSTDDSEWNENLPTEINPKRNSPDDLKSINNGTNPSNVGIKKVKVLPVVKSNAFSVKNSKSNAFQLKAQAYINHVKATISKPLGGKQMYFRFRLKEEVHKVISDDGDVSFECHICKGGYRQKFSLKRHFLRNHINPEYISAADLSNCKIPIQNEEIIQQYVDKSKTPSGRKRFKINGAIYLETDGKTKVPGLYKCHQCPGVRFDLEYELTEHYSSHLNQIKEVTHPCSLCPSVFQKRQALLKHKVAHTDKKVIFHCGRCPQEFEQITEYTWHLQTHESKKRCKYCEKEFSTPANRKRHENIHERGRVFSCKFCKAKFSRSKELDKHLKKMHNNLKLTCPYCPMQENPLIFISQHLLEAHIALKHRDIPTKKSVPSNKATGIYRTHSHKLSKESFCCYCKKKFSTVKAMVNHKNIVHKQEMALLKPKKFGQKELNKAKFHGESDGNRKFKNMPTEEKDLSEKESKSKAYEYGKNTGILGKKRTTYERKAKNSSHYKLSKDKLFRKKDDPSYKFFCNVSSNVADNLLNHVDGGLNQINLKKSNFPEQIEPFDFRTKSSCEIPWSAHNFSTSYFDTDIGANKKEEKSLLMPQELCLYAAGLERNEDAVETTLNLSCKNSSALEETTQSPSQNKSLILEEKGLVNYDVCVAYVCDVCKGTFPSYLSYEDHCTNNHPNVELSFVEIEGTSDNPPKIPGELKMPPYTQPHGMLIAPEVPLPTQEQSDIICTKCKTKFGSKNDLYTHIFQCVEETGDIPSRKKLNHKNKKGIAVKNSSSAIKSVKSSGWFSRNKQIFKSGCFRRNRFQSGKYYFSIKGNKRGKRKLPIASKLRANPCPYCDAVFISAAKLPEHTEICVKKYKKKDQVKKRKNDLSPELSPSPTSFSENGNSNDAVKNSNVAGKDTSLPSYSNDHVSSTEPKKPSSNYMNFSSSNSSLTDLPATILQTSDSKVNCSDLNHEESVVVERNNAEVNVLRDLVNYYKSVFPQDLQVENVNESCEKSNDLISETPTDKAVVNLKPLIGSSPNVSPRKNASSKSPKNEKSENITKAFTANTKEKLSCVDLPKVKEVIKEMQLSASSSANFKKSVAPLTFLSHEANQNVELSSQSNSLPAHTELNSQPVNESEVINESQRSEKTRQRKKRKPVKILHKMTNDSENSLKMNLSPFFHGVNVSATPCLLVNNIFKPIENSGEQMFSTSTDPEMSKLPDLVPEEDPLAFLDSSEKSDAKALESSIPNSPRNIQINTDDQILSTSVYLPEVEKDGRISGDRDSPSLELLVSSVTQSIENFDKPSLLDDEKFALPTPDLINPTTLKNTNMDLASNNGLNFKIIIPAGESPSKPQVSNKDSLDYISSGISAEKPPNDGPLSVSSNKSNVEGEEGVILSGINKMKSIMSVDESTKDASKLKNSDDSKVKDDGTHRAENSVINKAQALSPYVKNGDAANAKSVSQLKYPIPENVQSLGESEKELNNEGKLSEKSIAKERLDNKKDDESKSSGKKDDYTKDDSSDEEDDSSGFKKLAQGQTIVASKVVNIGPKSKQLKDKLKSKLKEVPDTSNEISKSESQKKKKVGSKSSNKKCDSENREDDTKLPVFNRHPPKNFQGKDVSTKPLVNNLQPTLEINKQLAGKDKSESGVTSSKTGANLRFLRMKKPASSDQALKRNIEPDDSSETNDLNNQMSKSRKNNPGYISTKASKDDGGCSKILDNSDQDSENVSKDGDSFSRTSDNSTNASVGDGAVVIKRERPDNEQLLTHRNCPYCYLDFAYLSNFRRHMKICPSRTENSASEAATASASSQYQHLPKKNEVEESLLNLLRHQSRQNQLIKDTKVATEDCKAKNSFQKFSCPICHKIYLSYFSFLQHQVKVHKMTHQETKSVNDGASTSQGVRIMPLEENECENNLHQDTRTINNEASSSDGVRTMPISAAGCENNPHQDQRKINSGTSTSQNVTVMPLKETGEDSNLIACNSSSKLTANAKDSVTTTQNSIKKLGQGDASKNERNGSDHNSVVGSKSGSLQNPGRHGENAKKVEKTLKTSASSPEGRNVSNPQNDKDLTMPSSVGLPVFGKGRGRKKKSMSENLIERKEDSSGEGHSKKQKDASAVCESIGDNSNLNARSPNSIRKEVGKSLFNDNESSPKNTLVNKLRNTLSKSIQSGGNVDTAPSKMGKKSETLKSSDVNDIKHIEKDSPPLKLPMKKNSVETSKTMVKGKAHIISQPTSASRRGRKKGVLGQISVKQTHIGDSQQESNDSLLSVDVPTEAIDPSTGVLKTELNSRLHDTPKANKLKSSQNQSLPDPESTTFSDERKPSTKKSNDSPLQSSKTTKAIKSTKTSPKEVTPDAHSSQKFNAVSNKVRNPRGIKAKCDNEPTPSTSRGLSRGRNSRMMNIPLDLSSEPEEVDEVQQRKIKQKKKPNNKICPICKQKFPALLQRNRHLQLVHGRKRSRNEGSVSPPSSVPVKKEAVNKVIDSPVKKEPANKIAESPIKKEPVNKVTESPATVPDRSAYQRQCSKPLPPMKRKYQKVGGKNIQPVKKTKL